jgi:hypothetical protein
VANKIAMNTTKGRSGWGGGCEAGGEELGPGGSDGDVSAAAAADDDDVISSAPPPAPFSCDFPSLAAIASMIVKRGVGARGLGARPQTR